MRYAVAVIACVLEAFAYALIGALLGWKSGGGVIPMMVLFAVWGITWTAITKRGHGVPESGAQSEDVEKQE